MSTASTQVTSIDRARRHGHRPFRVTVQGHQFRSEYRADSLFEALALAVAIKRGWPNATVHLVRFDATVRAARRRAA